ncbi:MAG: signal peptidase I [Alphaproteobacteria bacterium]
MAGSLGEQLRRYPQTYLRALVRPTRLQQPDWALRSCGPAAFVASSCVIGFVLSALLGDDDVFRYYEWRPWLAQVLDPASRLPGFAFAFAALLSGIGVAIAGAIALMLLRLSGAEVAIGAVASAFAYFAGGPMLTVVTLVQVIGLPLVFGAVVDLPDWTKMALPLAIGVYLFGWVVRQLANLPRVGWARGAAAAFAGAMVYVLAPLDPVAEMRLEPYAMTTNSMAPQLDAGSVSLANEAVFGWRKPAPGDLVVFFKVVGGAKVAVLRRVVGMSGDTVELRDGRLLVNGETVERQSASGPDRARQAGIPGQVFRETLPSGVSYEVIELDAGSAGDNVEPFEVPFAHVYVLADNRDGAIDSRQFGPVSIGELRGTVYYQLSPERRALR